MTLEIILLRAVISTKICLEILLRFFGHKELEDNWAKPISEELIPDFMQLIAPFDEKNPVPSCRNADQPYSESDFVVTVDGFLVSDNVTVEDALVLDTGFKWSDHNPVYMDFYF